MVLLYGFGTWNGASYYIEVFAERYRQVLPGGEGGSSVADTDTEEESEEYENTL